MIIANNGWLKVPADFLNLLGKTPGATYADGGLLIRVLLSMIGSDLRGYVPDPIVADSTEGLENLCALGFLARVERPRPGYVLINEARCEAFNGTEYEPRIPYAVRSDLHRDRSTCVKCGIELNSVGLSPSDIQTLGLDAKRDPTVDHIIPVSRGGTNDIGNLRLLCRSCNSTKGARL